MILYLTAPYGVLSRQGNALLYRDESGRNTVPVHEVESVVLFGNAHVTMPALQLLLINGVPVHYVKADGRYLGTLVPAGWSYFPLRKKQYMIAEDPVKVLEISKIILQAKLINQRHTLLRYYYRGHNDILREAAAQIERLIQRIDFASELDVLRGIEGQAANLYFEAFGAALNPPWEFRGRVRRPPPDPVNALLSFGYTLLLQYAVTAVLEAGLDPSVGFLHPPFRGRPSLALDLMEPFRPTVVDRWVVSICNQGKVKPRSFRRLDNGGVHLSEALFHEVIRSFSDRMLTETTNQLNGRQGSYFWHLRRFASSMSAYISGSGSLEPFVGR